MMKVLQNEWVVLFNATKYIVPSDSSLAKIFCDSKTIVDDTLIYSNHIPTLLHYFSCVAKVFTIYKLSFKMSKYYFFLSYIENVRHFLTATEIVLLNQSFSLSNNYLFYHLMYLFFLLFACVRSTIMISHGLNQVLHLCVVSCVDIIVKVFTSHLVARAY